MMSLWIGVPDEKVDVKQQKKRQNIILKFLSYLKNDYICIGILQRKSKS